MDGLLSPHHRYPQLGLVQHQPGTLTPQSAAAMGQAPGGEEGVWHGVGGVGEVESVWDV